jgi:hypothetical protein
MSPVSDAVAEQSFIMAMFLGTTIVPMLFNSDRQAGLSSRYGLTQCMVLQRPSHIYLLQETVFEAFDHHPYCLQLIHLPIMRLLFISTLFAANAGAYDTLLGFDSGPQVETRSLHEIYKAALKEGGIVTSWFGGDEKTQQNAVKKAFEAAFPGVTLNLTVDVSKYHEGSIDEQLAHNAVYVDTIALQTTHDFPRWKEEGALLHYAPVGFDMIYPDFRDSDAAFYGYMGIAWQLIWNSDKLKGKKAPIEFPDFLAPEYKGKLALTYPNDDDAILFQFNLM